MSPLGRIFSKFCPEAFCFSPPPTPRSDFSLSQSLPSSWERHSPPSPTPQPLPFLTLCTAHLPAAIMVSLSLAGRLALLESRFSATNAEKKRGQKLRFSVYVSHKAKVAATPKLQLLRIKREICVLWEQEARMNRRLSLHIFIIFD